MNTLTRADASEPITPATLGGRKAGVWHHQVGIMAGRFGMIFRGPARLISHGWGVAFGVLAIAAVVGTQVSPHLGIGFVALAQVLLCFRIERRHLDHLIMAPLVLVGFHHALSSGLGAPLVWYGVSHRFGGDGEFDEPFFLMQCASVAGFGCLMLGYWIFRRGTPGFIPASLDRKKPDKTHRIFCMVGWTLFLHYMIIFIAGYVTGGSDRTRITEFGGSDFTAWSIFKMFPRFPIMYFVLLPLMFQMARMPVRVLLFAMNGFLFFTFLISGSRGQLLTPICLLLIGWWSFSQVSRRVVGFIIIMICLALPYIPLIALYRSTEAFENTSQGDWLGRIEAFGKIREGLAAWDPEGLIQLTGESLLGADDPQIFRRSPDDIPFAGWENVERLKNFWLPTVLAPEKLHLLDMNDIVRKYRDSETLTGAGITFTADMYRRFGWQGIVLGNLILGAFLGAFYRVVFRWQRGRHPVVGTLIIVYFISYFTSTPYRTLLETCWIWLWEFPKHMIALAAIVMVAKSVVDDSGKDRVNAKSPSPASTTIIPL